MPKHHRYLVASAVVLLFLALFAVAVYQIYDHFFAMQKAEIIIDREGVAEDSFQLIYEGEILGEAPYRNGTLYLDMELINEPYAGGRLFFDELSQNLYYTTTMEKIRLTQEAGDYLIQGDTLYFSASKARELFGLEFFSSETYQRAVLLEQSYLAGICTAATTYLKPTPYEKDRSYLVALGLGEEVLLYEAQESPEYYYAVTKEGLRGYLLKEEVETESRRVAVKEPKSYQMDASLYPKGKVCLAWQPFYSDSYGESVYREIDAAKGSVNVISPGWLTLTAEGEIESYASREYVEYLHEAGIQVWPMFGNQFDSDRVYEALESEEGREAICRYLLDFCQEYGVEGINMDFEGLGPRTNRLYIQFLRELSITLRHNGYLLSVDTLVPSEWSEYYDRDVMYDVCDYVFVMAYDEHYAGSEKPGSVSSYSFTKSSLENMLAEGVHSDKLVLGIPWYTRIWLGDDADFTSFTAGMDYVESYIDEHELTESYDETTRQTLAEGEAEGERCRIWIENEDSLRWRLELAREAEIAGVAAWALGFEKESIWKIINETWNDIS